MRYIRRMTFRPPPSPWFYATTLKPSARIGIAPGSRVIVRLSRSGGWRICSSKLHVVVADKAIRLYLATAPQGVVLADQVKAEAHFQALLAEEKAAAAVAS